MKKSGSILGGTLLVSGTCIGGGVLALPVLTSLGGFIPSLTLYVLAWAFMACTGLLYLEATLWLEGESNIISMAGKTLGSIGKAMAWTVYLFFFYCLTVAYIVGCGNLVTTLLPFPPWVGPIAFVVIFAPFVIAGAKVVGRINLFCIIGLGLSYFAFLFIGYQFVDVTLLKQKNWSLSLIALPVIFAAFGYQGIVPTLKEYLGRDLKKTKQAILLGSFLPLVFYVIWQWLILGIVPVFGVGGLKEAMEIGETAVHPLKNFVENSNIYFLGKLFAFFALSTSFFGVTLGLQDFLADGLKIKKNPQGKFLLAILVFLPPLVIATTNPNIFIASLSLAGGIGSALLLGLLPILMVWFGRYRLKLTSNAILPGGKILLIILIAFVLFEILLEARHLIASFAKTIGAT